MQSATSSSKSGGLHLWFHPTLFRKNMTRFWPIWALYGAFWLFALPINLFTSYQSREAVYSLGDVSLTGPQYFARSLVPDSAPAAVPMGLIFGILAAMAVFSYLYQSRSVGLMHALPLRREGLFLTNYLSGLSFFALPLLVVFLLTLGAEALMGAVYLPALFCWLVANLLVALFFYSFAVFCAMFTGHILALPAFYGILNGLAFGICTLLMQVLPEFVYGFYPTYGPTQLTGWITPAYQLLRALYTQEVATPDGLSAYRLTGLGYVFLYALAGLVLAALALVIYRRRQLERAGDVVSVSWVRPIFKYGVAFCTALSLGLLLYLLFLPYELRGPWPFLICMIFAGAVGYFAAEMLLQKSFRVFARGWPGVAAFSLALVAAMCCIVFDLTGFERRVPDPAQVASVAFDGVGSAPNDSASHAAHQSTDPEEIALVARLHAALVAERDLSRQTGYTVERQALAGGTIDIETQANRTIRLSYALANGKQMFRQYPIAISKELLADPNSAASLLSQLVNRPNLVEQYYFDFLADYENVRLSDVSLSVLKETSDYEYTDLLPLDLDAAGRSDLLEAIRADIAAGDLGRRYLLEDESRYTNCYFNDLELIFYVSGSRLWAEGEYTNSPSVTITLQASAKHTLRVLTEHGLDPQLLLTMAEYEVRQNNMRDAQTESIDAAVYAQHATP